MTTNEKIKELLKVKINEKFKILIGLFIFLVINIIFGFITAIGIVFNFILLFVAFIIISIMDGVFKHYEK